MSRSKSLRGGEKKTIEIDAEDEKNIRLLESMLAKLRKKKISKPEYESPLDKMNARPKPNASNTITIQGRCPAPFKGCDAIAAQKAGKMCPDPRYAVYPYIQEEDTGALCYPNLDAAKIQREINDEKKAAARHSVMQLIKVLAAFNDADAAPEMCDVINKMNGEGKSRQIKQLYCENLSKGPNPLCEYKTDTAGKGTCSRKPSGSSLSLVLPPKPPAPPSDATLPVKKETARTNIAWLESAATGIERLIASVTNLASKSALETKLGNIQREVATITGRVASASDSEIDGLLVQLNEEIETAKALSLEVQSTVDAEKAAAAEAERVARAASAERKRAAAAGSSGAVPTPAPARSAAPTAGEEKYETNIKSRKTRGFKDAGLEFKFDTEEKRDFFDSSVVVEPLVNNYISDSDNNLKKTKLMNAVALIKTGVTNDVDLQRELAAVSAPTPGAAAASSTAPTAPTPGAAAASTAPTPGVAAVSTAPEGLMDDLTRPTDEF